MEKRNVKIDLETAKRWYFGDDIELQRLASFAFTKEELTPSYIKTWDELVKYEVSIPSEARWISNNSSIYSPEFYDFGECDKNIFIDEKHAKSALAMAQISQLMPYYGGPITDEEWQNETIAKYVIIREESSIRADVYYKVYNFLAFHTAEQLNQFLYNNERLVKDYYMLP